MTFISETHSLCPHTLCVKAAMLTLHIVTNQNCAACLFQFIRNHNEMFTFTTSTNNVSLKENIISSENESKSNPTDSVHNHRNNSGNQEVRQYVGDKAVTGDAVETACNDGASPCEESSKKTNSMSTTTMTTNRGNGVLCCEQHRGAGDSMLGQCAKCRIERTKSTAE